MGIIRFDAADAIARDCPAPYPAARTIPEWLKQMPMAALNDPNTSTVKRCPPFLEAMTSGYIIPLAEECSFLRDADGMVRVKSPHGLAEAHDASQYAGAPFSAWPVVKFLNPWVVVTELGYSTLFVAPINRGSIPFVPLSGVVETDTYYNHIHFPAVCMLPVGGQITLLKGTPLVQAIPFRREQWTSQTGRLDLARLERSQARIRENRHDYKESHWVKHEYD